MSTAMAESMAEHDYLRTAHLRALEPRGAGGFIEPMTAEIEAAAWRPAPLVYLAGSIAGLTHDGATGWRERATALLAPDILTLSPMRGKAYLRDVGAIGTAAYPQALSTDKGLTARDRFDVRRCDLMLANLDAASRVSVGTCVEFGWADAFGTPVVLVLDDGGLHDHPMLRQIAGWTVPTLAEACALARTILLP